MEKVKPAEAMPLAVQYAAANGDVKLTMGGNGNGNGGGVLDWLKGVPAVRKPGPLPVTDSVANAMGRVRAPLSRPVKPAV
jgi:hypothetical protein